MHCHFRSIQSDVLHVTLKLRPIQNELESQLVIFVGVSDSRIFAKTVYPLKPAAELFN